MDEMVKMEESNTLLITRTEYISLKEENDQENNIYFLMERGECDLEDYIKEKVSKAGGMIGIHFKICVVKSLLKLAETLAKLSNQGIHHRDIKPANIIVFEGKGKEIVLKLCDFGMSTSEKLSGKRTQFKLVGTPYYMAPEMDFNFKLDCCVIQNAERQDIYSFDDLKTDSKND